MVNDCEKSIINGYRKNNYMFNHVLIGPAKFLLNTTKTLQNILDFTSGQVINRIL